jgi:outer membrane protein assembly factor BamB
MQFSTYGLGEFTVGSNGIIAGNSKVELCIFPSISDKTQKMILPLSKHAIIAPVLEHDGTCFVGDEDGVFYAYDLKTGLKWTYQTGNKIAGGAVRGKDVILVGSYDQKLYALAPQDGTLLFTVECDSFINSSPILSESGDTVFLGSCDGAIRKINAKTGKITSQIDLSSPIPASPVLYDGVLYAVTHVGSLVAIQAEPFTLLYKMEVSSSYTSSPYAVDTFIFLTDDDGRITIYSRGNGKRLSVLEDTEKMTPLRTGNHSDFYAVSRRGKLYRYRKSNEGWNRDLLNDFQTDCRSSCQLFGHSIIFADDSGGLYFYEVSP